MGPRHACMHARPASNERAPMIVSQNVHEATVSRASCARRMSNSNIIRSMHFFLCLYHFFFFFYIFFIFFMKQKADRLVPKHMRHLTIWQVFRQVERRFHSRESNRQPLPWDLGIPTPSSGSLGLSWTVNAYTWQHLPHHLVLWEREREILPLIHPMWNVFNVVCILGDLLSSWFATRSGFQDPKSVWSKLS